MNTPLSKEAEQNLVNHLYNSIFTQKKRCNYYQTMGCSTSNSVWNKSFDETKILDVMVESYKGYYKDKAEEIRIKLDDIKETNVKSYLTYDTEYYINEYNDRIAELNKYLVELDTKTLEDVQKNPLSLSLIHI